MTEQQLAGYREIIADCNGLCEGSTGWSCSGVKLLLDEIDRLKRGDFTPEEFQNLCHRRDEKPGCTPEDFFTGCAMYQQKLFGRAAFASLMEDNERLRAACRMVLNRWTFNNQQVHTHTWHDWADCKVAIEAAMGEGKP